MTFNDAFAHYRAGTASEAERALVESELEKNRLISEYLDEAWQDAPDTATIDTQGIKHVRRTLRLRAALLVLCSLTLCAAVFLLIQYAAIPAAEQQYWDPEESSFSSQFSNDLELTLAAYSELFIPGQCIGSVSSRHTDFASYDITVQHWDAAAGSSQLYAYGTLREGTLTLPNELTIFTPINIFENACHPAYPMAEDTKEDFYEKLSALPDYIHVEAAVSFAEDMSMEELTAFEESLEEGFILWVGIRNCPEEEQLLPLCGMAPFVGGVIREGLNEAYPYFEIKGEARSPENLKAHFKSLLRFSADRLSAERGIPSIDPWYYQEVLAYVEEAGIQSYGCYLSAPAHVFLALLDSGTASQVWPQDAAINIP